MGNRHRRHNPADDKSAPPIWAVASWVLVAAAFVILALGLSGLWAFPYFPGVALGIFVAAVAVRYFNDWLYRQRQAAH